MKKLFAIGLGTIISCSGMPSDKTSPMQDNAQIIVSESQGGTGKPGFTILKNEQEFQSVIRKSQFGIVEAGTDVQSKMPAFPKGKTVVLYNLGTFNSGDHTVTQINNISVQNKVLYVEVPQKVSGGMEIQVISHPWIIFAVPAEYQFNSVELKYSK